MDEPKGERRCAVGVGAEGEPIFEQFVRLAWAEQEFAHFRTENEQLKELEDTASSCVVEANTIENQLRAKVAELKRQLAERIAHEDSQDRLFMVARRQIDDFKNFHRNLCMRFDYHHDELNWRRDLASLEEHIAAQLTEANAKLSEKGIFL